MNMTAILDELATLPPDRQEEVADFVAFLRSRDDSARPVRQSAMAPTQFIGMWADRHDMDDSGAWVRSLRRREWASPHE